MELLFVFLLQSAAGAAAVSCLSFARSRGGATGVVRDLAILAGAFLLWIAGAGLLFHLPCRGPGLELAVFTLSGIGGFVPFGVLTARIWGRRKKEISGYLCGLAAMLIHSGALFYVVWDTWSVMALAPGEKLFREDLMDAVCHFMLPGAALFFLPIFVLLDLILGAKREKIKGILKNILFISFAPAGIEALPIWFLLFRPGGLPAKPDGLDIAGPLLIWFAFLFVPYAVMLVRGICQKDRLRTLNGITGIGGMIFFLLGVMLLACITRHV